jgi:hypothetical protein
VKPARQFLLLRDAEVVKSNTISFGGITTPSPVLSFIRGISGIVKNEEAAGV